MCSCMFMSFVYLLAESKVSFFPRQYVCTADLKSFGWSVCGAKLTEFVHVVNLFLL